MASKYFEKDLSPITVSIIITHVGNTQILIECIDSISDAVGSFTYEIVVVVNGPIQEEEIIGKLTHANCKVIITKDLIGYSAASNIGFQHANGKYILWSNNDLIFTDGSISQLIVFLEEHGDYCIVGPSLRNSDGTYQPSFSNIDMTPLALIIDRLRLGQIFQKHDLVSASFQGNEEDHDIEVTTGACALIKSNVLKDINGFPRDYYMYCEEFQLCRDIRKLGYKIRYMSTSHVTHLGGQSTKEMKTRFLLLNWRSRMQYIHKNFGFISAQCLRIVLIMIGCVYIFAGAITSIMGPRGNRLNVYSKVLFHTQLVRQLMSQNFRSALYLE